MPARRRRAGPSDARNERRSAHPGQDHNAGENAHERGDSQAPLPIAEVVLIGLPLVCLARVIVVLETDPARESHLAQFLIFKLQVAHRTFEYERISGSLHIRLTVVVFIAVPHHLTTFNTTDQPALLMTDRALLFLFMI